MVKQNETLNWYFSVTTYCKAIEEPSKYKYLGCVITNELDLDLGIGTGLKWQG